MNSLDLLDMENHFKGVHVIYVHNVSLFKEFIAHFLAVFINPVNTDI